MTTQGAGKTLPIILAAITLATALFFWKQREILRQKTQELLDRSSKQISMKLPEPRSLTSPDEDSERSRRTTPTPVSISQTNESNESNLTNKSKTQTPKTIASAQSTRTETVCTPVYGMANTCAEHTVVDTALDTTIFYNLAGLSYFAGLAAFIKAKKRA